jgi:hypothetical protein
MRICQGRLQAGCTGVAVGVEVCWSTPAPSSAVTGASVAAGAQSRSDSRKSEAGGSMGFSSMAGRDTGSTTIGGVAEATAAFGVSVASDASAVGSTLGMGTGVNAI